MPGKEGPCHKSKRGDVAERANIKKRTPAQAVDQPESDKCENEIGKANANRLQQGGLRAETGKFKDARGEVQNRIDARHLIEECNQNGEENRFPKTRRPKMIRRCLLR